MLNQAVIKTDDSKGNKETDSTFQVQSTDLEQKVKTEDCRNNMGGSDSPFICAQDFHKGIKQVIIAGKVGAEFEVGELIYKI